jgi:hypothetical protein
MVVIDVNKLAWSGGSRFLTGGECNILSVNSLLPWKADNSLLLPFRAVEPSVARRNGAEGKECV